MWKTHLVKAMHLRYKGLSKRLMNKWISNSKQLKQKDLTWKKSNNNLI